MAPPGAPINLIKVGDCLTPRPLNGARTCSDQARLVESLCDPSVYDHPVRDIRVVETHISYLILTGNFAYKIKKSISLSFLDFSTLEKRKYYCEQELSLNRRLAPDLYLKVVPITGTYAQPSFAGDGEAVEYAVKMVQFDTAGELSALIGTGKIDADMIGVLAEEVADFHQRVERANGQQEFGSFDLIQRRIKDNFVEIAPCVEAGDTVLNGLESWVDDHLRDLSGYLQSRRDEGFIREGHGDMHLGNMVLIGNRIRLFDCLEFNQQLRWTDVMSEVAFLFMDLDYHERRELAFHFLNRYLRATGDYAGLRVFPLYLVYRAMVRAKVACIRHRQTTPATKELATKELGGVSAHLALACRYTRPPPARLVITHGMSGSGKSWIAERIVGLMPVIHVRSDVERFRPGESPASAEPGNDRAGRYSARNIERVYQRLLDLAGVVLDAGFSVIVDATFLLRHQRRRFAGLAEARGVPFTILDIRCPEQVLRSRVQERLVAGEDPSEATVKVLERQFQVAQPLSEDERGYSVSVNSGNGDVDLPGLVQRIVSP